MPKDPIDRAVYNLFDAIFAVCMLLIFCAWVTWHDDSLFPAAWWYCGGMLGYRVIGLIWAVLRR